MRTLITNGTIVTADGSQRADVLIEGESIAAIANAIRYDGYGQTLGTPSCTCAPS